MNLQNLIDCIQFLEVIDFYDLPKYSANQDLIVDVLSKTEAFLALSNIPTLYLQIILLKGKFLCEVGDLTESLKNFHKGRKFS